MNAKIYFICASILILVFTGCKNPYEGKKVLYVDSYHEGYPWSDNITAAIKGVFEDTGVQLKVIRMDTKRNPGEEFGKQATLYAKEAIQSFKPDVVITSDDNAFKYLVMEYYKDAALPFVYCGINWDSSVYGAPYSNTAGMIEVTQISQLVEYMKEYAKGDRIGFLNIDTETARKEAENYKKVLGTRLLRFLQRPVH